ncbi:hypothetical protein [Nonomuraea turcica]|uniref:hypothetical protein n=1 Tax=Nonomuraea sp. G32 TaxID=3067274 RepID=UPI00273B849A|nr:hypothetical protein [Nonomuraea sp. G32]MDP4505114.1 hypothetical protein [Nonomuraea sp. G32]
MATDNSQAFSIQNLRHPYQTTLELVCLALGPLLAQQGGALCFTLLDRPRGDELLGEGDPRG